MSGRFVITMENVDVGGGNFAQCDFACGMPGGASAEQIAMQIAAFFATSAGAAANTFISGISFREDGAAGSLPVPFTPALYNPIAAAYSAPNQTGYGFTYGNGALTPVGTSMTVLENTLTPGRRSTGRIYLPFVSAAALTTAGTIDATLAALIETRFNEIVIGNTPVPNGTVVSGLEVRSSFGPTAYLVQRADVRLTPANLRRRRR